MFNEICIYVYIDIPHTIHVSLSIFKVYVYINIYYSNYFLILVIEKYNVQFDSFIFV